MGQQYYDDDDGGISDPMTAYISQASDINGQLVLLIFIAAILGLGKGGVPGFATVATALTVATAPMNIEGGLGYAVSLQVPILAMIDISAAGLHRTSIDWYTTRLLLPLSFLGMFLGQILDRYMTDALARILVGFILLSILTLKVWKDVVTFVFPRQYSSNKNKDGSVEGGGNYVDIESLKNTINESNKKKHSPPVSREPSEANPSEILNDHRNLNTNTNISKMKEYIWACIVGLFGGAATMLTNSMGPILNVYLLGVRKLSPTQYIGTRAAFFCCLNAGKIPMRFASGALGWNMIPLAFGLGLVSVVGVFCAKPIMLSMKESTFVMLELLVVAFAGIRLMWLGLTMS
mmetsp:Transcript_20181/g.30275  ORF Transcript_20181/g.30275 Transcript_20181/m.30275 type:complete len:348 (+) Transcript_20181:83-1126(+)